MAFLPGQQALTDQGLQIDEVRVSGKGGKGLIGRIPVACRSQRQDLSEALPCIRQVINELTRFSRKASDPVQAGKAEDRKQYTALSHTHLIFISAACSRP